MTDELKPTQAGIFSRIVTHEQARQAAKNFIDAHFNNKDGKGVLTGIPARPDHDDILLTDYIRQQAATDTQVSKLVSALTRQTENMAFVLNRVSLPEKWYAAFTTQLAEDRAALDGMGKRRDDPRLNLTA